ncbi:MAG: alkaline phosphatase PhoX [Planctomycetota bacterium]
MNNNRRDFLRQSAAFATGFAGLRLASLPARARASDSRPAAGFGPLIDDPEGLLDLPDGFSYQVIGRTGEEMADGLLLPGLPDGMAAFAGPGGTTLIMRNHELAPNQLTAFGEKHERLDRAPADRLYDAGAEVSPGVCYPGAGGVSTVVYDTRSKRVVRQFMALAGTTRNCAGGPTPWGSWITCEESIDSPTYIDGKGYKCAQSHGYAFDVPAGAEPKLHRAAPLTAMGRFRREAVAIDPASSVVFQTEDMDDGAFYRFVPNQPGKLTEGGKLQALAIDGRPSLDTRNWDEVTCTPGETMRVRWIDLDDPESPGDDLRYRAFDAGAARFARGEGIWWTGDDAVFACTSGGVAKIGQLWRYTPGGDDEGTLELFIEPNDTNLIHNADNLTAAPWGDLVVCEDRQGDVVRLVGVTPEGTCYTLANNQAGTEFAGVCFSPDGSTLFVNLQHEGLTIAVTGPWGHGS